MSGCGDGRRSPVEHGVSPAQVLVALLILGVVAVVIVAALKRVGVLG